PHHDGGEPAGDAAVLGRTPAGLVVGGAVGLHPGAARRGAAHPGAGLDDERGRGVRGLPGHLHGDEPGRVRGGHARRADRRTERARRLPGPGVPAAGGGAGAGVLPDLPGGAAAGAGGAVRQGGGVPGDRRRRGGLAGRGDGGQHGDRALLLRGLGGPAVRARAGAGRAAGVPRGVGGGGRGGGRGGAVLGRAPAGAGSVPPVRLIPDAPTRGTLRWVVVVVRGAPGPRRGGTLPHNGLRTALLLGGLSASIIAVGWWLGGGTGLQIAFVLALVTNGFAYFFSDRIALSAMRARPVSEVEQPTLYRIVRELPTEARQPMPRRY